MENLENQTAEAGTLPKIMLKFNDVLMVVREKKMGEFFEKFNRACIVDPKIIGKEGMIEYHIHKKLTCTQ